MTEAQAKKLAKQIFDRFDKRIVEAVLGSNVPPRFIAGLIGNEAGKDRRTGEINESATRFEPHVFAALKAVRDGKRANYSGVRREQIADASDAALRALATSYGATQIMGWHVINNLHSTIADLRNPDKHFFYTVKLLGLNGFPRNADEAAMDREMREWNTGKETGKTFHANYVPNARKLRAAYATLEAGRVSRTVAERIEGEEIPADELPTPAQSEPSNNRSGEHPHDTPEAQQAGPHGTDETRPPEASSGQWTEASGQKDEEGAITQYIPKITAAKRWLGGLGIGGILSTTWAAISGLPPWAVFTIGILTALLVVGLIVLFIKYNAKLFDLVKQIAEINAQPELTTIKLTADESAK